MVMRNFIEALVPIGIVVVLPIIIVMMEMRRRKHEVDKRTEIMLKAIEKGVDIDPALFQMPEQPKPVKTAKDKLMGFLTAACVTSMLGLISAIVSAAVLVPAGVIEHDPGIPFFIFLICGILLAVGIAFFIVYFVGKRTYAKELAELDAASAQTTDNQ